MERQISKPFYSINYSSDTSQVSKPRAWDSLPDREGLTESPSSLVEREQGRPVQIEREIDPFNVPFKSVQRVKQNPDGSLSTTVGSLPGAPGTTRGFLVDEVVPLEDRQVASLLLKLGRDVMHTSKTPPHGRIERSVPRGGPASHVGFPAQLATPDAGGASATTHLLIYLLIAYCHMFATPPLFTF